MAVEHAIVALREHWDDVMSRLGAADGERLHELVGNLLGPDQAAALSDLAEFLVDTLPAEHLVRRALSGGYLFRSGTANLAVLTLDLFRTAQVSLADPALSPSGWILDSVVERLLGVPALTEAEVRGRGSDPADPGLIRLERADGGGQWPAFQFAPAAGPLPVVRAVNQLLGAAADPVGVADWWLSKNGWLDDQPCRLIGRVPDDLLVQAARAIRSEV